MNFQTEKETTLDNLLNQLEIKISGYETLNLEVSQSNVAWHIEHSLLVLNGITNLLVKSDSKAYKWKFNWIRIVVFTMGKIPRGRAKSPKTVQPKVDLSRSSLQKHLTETRIKIKELDFISKDKYFEHPFFGNLKLEQAIHFLEIHTKHHLKIIEDILDK